MAEGPLSHLKSLDGVDVEAFLSSSKPAAALDLLAEASVAAALGRRERTRLATIPGLAVIVEVPGATWITPIAGAIERLARAAKVVQVSATIGKRSVGDRFDEERAVKSLAGGRTVVAVTSAPDQLPTSFLATADIRVIVEVPKVDVVRGVISDVCDGSARSLRARDVVGLGLHDLAAAIRPGTARAAIERLRRASAHKSLVTLRFPDAPLVADLVGYGEAKAWAIQAVEDFARQRSGAAVRLTGAILAGPPGTGKTTLAQSIARSAGVSLIVSNVAAWFSTSRGDLDGVIKAMQAAFQAATETAPCILFLDELDALPSRTRLSPRGADWWTPVITGCLLEVDRLRASGRAVLLMGATNHAGHIEPALCRPGRFDQVIEIAIPEGDDLAGIFRQHLRGDLTDADIALIVRLVRRATGAQVVGWIGTARRTARDAGRALGRDDLLAAAIPPDLRSDAELRRVALHEAGHTVVALALGAAVRQTSIVPAAEAGGMTAVGEPSGDTRSDLDTRVAIALGGRAADEVLGAGPGAGAVADLAAATRMAAMARASFGLAGGLLHHDPDLLAHRLAMDRTFAQDVETDLRAALTRARSIIEERRDLVEVIAGELVRRRVLDSEDLIAVMKRRKRQSPPRPERSTHETHDGPVVNRDHSAVRRSRSPTG